MSKDLEFKTYKGKIIPLALFTSIFQAIITIIFTDIAFSVEIDGKFILFMFMLIFLFKPLVFIVILAIIYLIIKFILAFDSKSIFHSLKEKKVLKWYKYTLLISILIIPLSLKISYIFLSISLCLLLYLYFIIFKEYEKSEKL